MTDLQRPHSAKRRAWAELCRLRSVFAGTPAPNPYTEAIAPTPLELAIKKEKSHETAPHEGRAVH